MKKIVMTNSFRSCLAGLHQRLRPEPYQTVEFALAPGVELVLEPLVASEGETERHFRGSFQHRLPFSSLALGGARKSATEDVGVRVRTKRRETQCMLAAGGRRECEEHAVGAG
jgi:hypothetical protein